MWLLCWSKCTEESVTPCKAWKTHKSNILQLFSYSHVWYLQTQIHTSLYDVVLRLLLFTQTSTVRSMLQKCTKKINANFVASFGQRNVLTQSITRHKWILLQNVNIKIVVIIGPIQNLGLCSLVTLPYFSSCHADRLVASIQRCQMYSKFVLLRFDCVLLQVIHLVRSFSPILSNKLCECIFHLQTYPSFSWVRSGCMCDCICECILCLTIYKS